MTVDLKFLKKIVSTFNLIGSLLEKNYHDDIFKHKKKPSIIKA